MESVQLSAKEEMAHRLWERERENRSGFVLESLMSLICDMLYKDGGSSSRLTTTQIGEAIMTAAKQFIAGRPGHAHQWRAASVLKRRVSDFAAWVMEGQSEKASREVWSYCSQHCKELEV